ncbi:MAG TPA: APC family permease [Rhizomicrobium sp.]
MAEATAAPRLKFLDTTLYAIVATIGIRWLPVAAAIGPSSLPLWLLAFFIFYIPLGAATAELTARYQGGGSLYSWTRGAFGPLSAFVCGWFYWISLLPYLAGIIYFLSGLILSAVGADTHNTTLYLAVSVVVTTIATAIQLLGLRFGKWLTSLGAAGSWSIFFLIIAAAAILLARNQGATNFLTSSYIAPRNFDTAILWGTIVFGISGAESVAFLRNDIEGGMRTIRRVLVALGVAMALIYMVGTAAMLVILPQAQLTRLSGLADALHAAFAHVGFPALAVFAIAFFALSQFGGLTAWFGIGARLPLEAGIDNFLPPVFAKRSARTGAPVPAILLQGGLTLFVVILSQAGEGAAAAYDFLLAMSVLTATIPYIYVFAAYLARDRWPAIPDAWIPPGGARTGIVLGVVGMISTLVAIACTMVPSGTDLHPLATFLKIVFSTLGALAVGLFLYWLGQRRARGKLSGLDR